MWKRVTHLLSRNCWAHGMEARHCFARTKDEVVHRRTTLPGHLQLYVICDKS